MLVLLQHGLIAHFVVCFLYEESGIELRAPYIPMDDLTFVSNVVSVDPAAEHW